MKGNLLNMNDILLNMKYIFLNMKDILLNMKGIFPNRHGMLWNLQCWAPVFRMQMVNEAAGAQIETV